MTKQTISEPAIPVTDTETDESTLHTCACGEVHQHIPGGPSHREACVSEKKNTDSCCCGSGNAPEHAQHRCGHGPRCR